VIELVVLLVQLRGQVGKRKGGLEGVEEERRGRGKEREEEKWRKSARREGSG